MFNWSEAHLSKVTPYKIHILVDQLDTIGQGIITKEYQKRSKNSVSAQVVAVLVVVTLI